MASENGAAVKKKKQQIDFNDKAAVVEQYMPYVRSIAAKVKKKVPNEIEFSDLEEYGMLGLLEAAERFDPEKGYNFMTFSYYRIRGAVYDGLRSMGWMSRTEYARARFEERANEYLAEVAHAEEMGTEAPENPFDQAVEELATVVQGLAAVYITSLDAAECLQVEDQATARPDEAVGLEQARALVRETITRLGDQERQLLEMYYYGDKTLQEVGASLGLSKSWTCRLHARAIKKLKRLLEDSLGP